MFFFCVITGVTDRMKQQKNNTFCFFQLFSKNMFQSLNPRTVCDGSLCLSEWYCDECQVIGTLLTTENLLFPTAVKRYYLYHQRNAENSLPGTAVGKSNTWLLPVWEVIYGYLCKKLFFVLQEVFFKLDGFKFQALILSSPAVDVYHFQGMKEF